MKAKIDFSYSQAFVLLDTLAYCNLFNLVATVYHLDNVVEIDIYFQDYFVRSFTVALRSYRSLSEYFSFSDFRNDYSHHYNHE